MDDIAQAVSDVMRLKEENQELIKESLNKTNQIERLNSRIEALKNNESKAELITRNEILRSMIYAILD